MTVDDVKSDYGPLTGTDKQVGIIRAAMQNPDMTIQQFEAEHDEYTQPYTEQVMIRADESFADEIGVGDEWRDVVRGVEPPEEEQDGAEPVDTGGRPLTPAESERSGFAFVIPGVGHMIDVESTETCAVCGETHTVTYIVPAERSVYLDPPECGHHRVTGDLPDHRMEDIAHVRDVLREDGLPAFTSADISSGKLTMGNGNGNGNGVKANNSD